MDFEKVLRVARKNELTKKEPVKCLQTKFKPPTKEQHEKDKLLSEGVQRFLARKEEEEKRKQKEAERRKQELMALRAKDPKANKRIQTMLKRTKSANKSVMEDAVDNNNTADTLAGPSQPDEDDYGFVSESSSQLYNKLIQKMYSTPSDDLPKFAPSKKPTCGNLSNTKERVKMALLKQEEEERLPHKRKRRGKEKEKDDDDDDDTNLNYSAPDRNLNSSLPEQSKEKQVKPKIKRPPPPPVDFHELLKIAEQKQHEPIVFEPKKPQEPEVLMTKKQKIEHEKMEEWKRQRELRQQQAVENGRKTINSQDDKKPIPKIPKLNSSADPKTTNSTSHKNTNGNVSKLSINNKPSVKSQDKNEKSVNITKPKPKNDKSGPNGKIPSQTPIDKKYKDLNDETSRLIKERDEALRILKEKEREIRERDEAVRKLKEKEQLIRERDEAVRKLKLLEESEKMRNSAKNNVKSAENSVSKSAVASQKINSNKAVVKNVDRLKSNTSKGNLRNESPSQVASGKVGDSKTSVRPENKTVPEKSGSREFPPKYVKPVAKLGSQAAGNLRSKQFPPADVRRKVMALKRRVIESDEEHDSELDDFIDDDDHDVDSEDVSKVISEIFRYDKNKYSRYDDADDECMESNFAQISKEEFISTKCGILEDLQDIQREKAKLAKKKKR